jgi:acyl-CoA synthetase (AMP-forming)/AMP-acid ligase II
MLIELLRRAAAQAPEQPVVISPGRCESYGDLLARSEAVARGLLHRRIERFGCALDHPADVLVVLAASSAAGSEACVYPRELDASGISKLASAFAHETVVSDRELHFDVAGSLSLGHVAVESGPPLRAPESSPVLILTTGTTGDPKGARHDWSRLVTAVRHADQRAGKRWLLAYNLNQFGGLQVVLHVLVSRATMVASSSARPEDVIEVIREYGVTHVSATPTFWRLIVGSLDAERAAGLPLEQITLGGEAVQEGLIERLGRLFPRARISQIYGSTESGTAVAVGDRRSGLPLSILERGEDAAVRLRIAEGELQMKSQIGMLGYHERSDDAGSWRPTGDLVEVRGDRIFFVGRKTDIINVGGAKVHPLPVEELACAIDGVELAAVYGRPNPVTGQIVVIDVVAARGADTAALEAQIRTACEALPRAARPRRIRFVDSLQIRGHKVLRHRAGTHA